MPLIVAPPFVAPAASVRSGRQWADVVGGQPQAQRFAACPKVAALRILTVGERRPGGRSKSAARSRREERRDGWRMNSVVSGVTARSAWEEKLPQDYVVAQHWDAYGDEEHRAWRQVLARNSWMLDTW